MIDVIDDIMTELKDCKARINELEAELDKVKRERDGYFRKLEIVRKYLNTLQKQGKQAKPVKKA